MRRFTIFAACAGLVLILGLAPPMASAYVSVSLRVGDPYPGPRLVFVQQPHIVFIPGTRVYYIDDVDYDLYRYGGYWYYYYDGGWYRSYDYDGPFYFISYQSVPRSIRVVPVQYRHHWRTYRGPAYTYYSSGRWYRQNPGSHVTRVTYTGAGRRSGSASSGGYREPTTTPGHTHGGDQGDAGNKGHSDREGGGGKGKGHGQGKGHGHEH